MESKNRIFIGLFTSLIVLVFLLLGSFFYFYPNKEDKLLTQQSVSHTRSNQEKNKASDKSKKSTKKKHSSQKSHPMQSPATKITSSEFTEQLTSVQSCDNQEVVQAPVTTAEEVPETNETHVSQESESQESQEEVARQQAIAEAKLKAQALKDDYEARGYNVTINQK